MPPTTEKTPYTVLLKYRKPFPASRGWFSRTKDSDISLCAPLLREFYNVPLKVRRIYLTVSVVPVRGAEFVKIRKGDVLFDRRKTGPYIMYELRAAVAEHFNLADKLNFDCYIWIEYNV